MKHVGFTRYEHRSITSIDARGHGPLYRVTFGTPLNETDEFWCEWCGKSDGRFYSFNDSLEQAEGRDSGLPGPLYCGLHCWGQEVGATEL